MYSLEKFQKSNYSFIAYQDEKRIFVSRASALKPILFFLNKNNKKNLIIYDKIIGRAAALLLSLAKPQIIYTPVLSYAGEKILKQYKIKVEFSKKVEFISAYSKVKMCHWEKLAQDKTPQQFLKLISKGSKF